jgi:lysophospholipase L1-like esterase
MIASLIGAAAIAIVVYDSLIVGRALLVGNEVASRSEPFRQQPAEPNATLLVVGDSTGVGTGSEHPRQSLAGRLGTALPQARIDNLAVNGALTSDVLGQLKEAPLAHYDAVLVQVGGNDALRFTPIRKLKEDIGAVLASAGERGDYTALMSTGDLGAAPALPWPIAYVFSARSRAVRDTFIEVAHDSGTDYVDLFGDSGSEIFQQDAKRYYAADRLHLSGEGYGIWYQQLRDATELPERLRSNASGH